MEASLKTVPIVFGDAGWETLLKDHSGELTILTLTLIIVSTLFVVVPQLLRAHLQKVEWIHIQRMKSLEQGIPPAIEDDRCKVAGRTALLVPMVVMIAAGTVTCFLIAYKSESIFAVSLAIWVVGGVVSLAAITGGVALIGRLAQIQAGADDDEEIPDELMADR